MSLVKFKSQKPLNSFWDELFNREFFDSSLANMPGKMISGSTVPAINIHEDGDGYAIEVAAPGFEKSDINVSVEDRSLIVSAQKKTENEESGKKFTRREFSYTEFSRSFKLPELIDESKISASYENGILYVQVPKLEEAKAIPARTVKIK